MKLQLKRPLVFFDLETTGITIGSDRIVEISMVKILTDNSKEIKTYRVNPQMPIPLESSLIHGVYDDDVKDAPTFADLAPQIVEFIADGDLAGYNSNKFDIPLLLEEFLRVGIAFDMKNRKFVDVQNIFHQMEPRTLKAAYKFYCQKELVNAHSAEADTLATYEVFLTQLEKYENQPFENKKGEISYPIVNDIDALHEFTNIHKVVDYAGRLAKNASGEICFNFGKHKGKTLINIFESEPSYYDWMQKGDFPLYTKKILEEIWQEWKANKLQGKSDSKAPLKTPAAKNKKDTPITNQMLLNLKENFGKS